VADKLSIYNGALKLVGERFLASLTEEREPRRLLDHVWDSGGVKACLEMGQWSFAMCSMQLDYDADIEPGFGYHRAFTKPADWVLTSAVCEDEFFRAPLLRYWDEANYWYSDIDTIYVRYVSNHADYGMNLGRWPESFREMVEEYFCSRVVKKITGSLEEEDASKARLREKLVTAKSRSAMGDPPRFAPPGAWSQARMRYGGNRDRGNRGSLIG
jgi:hypothetical protein